MHNSVLQNVITKPFFKPTVCIKWIFAKPVHPISVHIALIIAQATRGCQMCHLYLRYWYLQFLVLDYKIVLVGSFGL